MHLLSAHSLLSRQKTVVRAVPTVRNEDERTGIVCPQYRTLRTSVQILTDPHQFQYL